MWLHVTIQHSPFDLAQEEAMLRSQHPDIGGIVAFQGVVRSHDAAVPLRALCIEHYPVLTEQEITNIAHVASKRWPIIACRIIHRIGELLPGEPIVLVLVGTQHREAGFQAVQFLMNQIKTQVSLWKREELIDGSHYWAKAQSLAV
ncbi:MAG: molybdenum cofactor biosynthesis protein MoaE [Neisseriales bacterium]|nr:MAG: molybdenum cofactor biosynthesis protein MoaE [Neisseriales bacterium]